MWMLVRNCLRCLTTVGRLPLRATMTGASQPLPYADEYYSNAGVAFTSAGLVVFTATTAFQFQTLSVTSCTLQIKEGREWNKAASLTPPSLVAKNRFTYAAKKNYSSSCTSGNTYRIVAAFNADGQTITKTSGEVKF